MVWRVVLVFLFLLTSCTFFPGKLVLKEHGVIVRVVDGDTFKVRLDDGRVVHVRLLGIDFPDVSEDRIVYWTGRGWEENKIKQCFDDGNSFVKEEFLRAPVKLFSDTKKANKDKYGRLLRYVFVEGQNQSINELLVGQGWAVHRQWFGPECVLCPELKQLQARAQKERVGCLWE